MNNILILNYVILKASKIAYRKGIAKAIIAIFFPSLFFLSLSPLTSKKPIAKIPITIIIIAKTDNFSIV